VDVSPLQRRDVRAAAGVLARAFYDDPVTSWMLPDDRTRLKALTRSFAPLARHHFLPRAGSEVGLRDGTVGAATLWDPPGQRKPSMVEQLITMPAMLWAFGSRVPASMRVMELMEKHHPEEPHWYLMLIGSDPAVGEPVSAMRSCDPGSTGVTQKAPRLIWRTAIRRTSRTTYDSASK